MTTHFEIYQAQNGILELWVELGIVGVVIILVTLVRAVLDVLICIQREYSPETTWFICMISLTVIYNIDETFLASPHCLPWVLYSVACIGLRDRVRRIRAQEARDEQFRIERMLGSAPHFASSSCIC